MLHIFWSKGIHKLYIHAACLAMESASSWKNNYNDFQKLHARDIAQLEVRSENWQEIR